MVWCVGTPDVDINRVERPQSAVELSRPFSLRIASHEIAPDLVVLADLEPWITGTLVLVDDDVGPVPVLVPPGNGVCLGFGSCLDDVLQTLEPLAVA